MENKLGLINEPIRLVKKNEELSRKILKLRGWDESKLEYVNDCLKYNMMTADQFSDLVGKSRPTINDRLRARYNNHTGKYETKLDHCYPFRCLNAKGQIFILRNEKSDKYLGKE